MIKTLKKPARKGHKRRLDNQVGIDPRWIRFGWKSEFIERAAEVFKKGPSTAEKELKEKNERVAQLERKIGQLTYEVDWLKKKKSEEIVGPDWEKRFH